MGPPHSCSHIPLPLLWIPWSMGMEYEFRWPWGRESHYQRSLEKFSPRTGHRWNDFRFVQMILSKWSCVLLRIYDSKTNPSSKQQASRNLVSTLQLNSITMLVYRRACVFFRKVYPLKILRPKKAIRWLKRALIFCCCFFRFQTLQTTNKHREVTAPQKETRWYLVWQILGIFILKCVSTLFNDSQIDYWASLLHTDC